MSLPVNLQMGLSSDGFGIRTPEVQESLTTNPIIAVGNNASVLSSINQKIQNNEISQYRFPLDLPKYNFTIIQHNPFNNPAASIENITTFIQNGLRREIGNVSAVYRLPLPTRLVDSHSTNFADIAPLEMAANAAKIGFGAFRVNRIQAIANALRKNERAKGRTLRSSDAQKVAERAVEKRFEMVDGAINAVEKSSGIIDTVGALFGIKIQNAKVVAITDPDFRTFALSWHFIPKSFNESIEIQKICYNFRKNMTPVRVDTYSYVTKFPSVYTMFFQPNVKFLYKFKPCVLTSISVDYKGGSGVPAFYKPQENTQSRAAPGSPLAAQQEGINLQFSPPESIILNTTWLELDYFVQQHYENDHNDTEDLPTNAPYGVLKDSFTFAR